MSNESIRVHFAQGSQELPVRSNRLTAGRKATASVLLCALMLLGSACDDSGSDGSNKSAASKIETQPVDLPPGQTQAAMAWEPSAGPVTNYLVFASRNGAIFEFEQSSTGPSATISGEAGDEIRIVVVALSENGSMSDASPPSAPIRFHPDTTEPALLAAATSVFDRAAAVPAFVSIGVSDASASSPSQAQTETQIAEQDLPAVSADALQVAEAETPEAVVEADSEIEDAEGTRKTALLERLMSADARLSPHGRSNAADAWVQSFVDEELAAGVAFVGTGNANDDGMRELVWQDSSGQLFVSDGQVFLNSENPADTFEEALRLQTNERFVAFENLGTEAESQWLIEDTLTGQVFVVPSDASSTRDGTPLNRISDDLRLIGLGDFDGDGRGDLLWRSGKDAAALALGSAENGWIPTRGSEIAVPEDRRTDLPLAIADLNGDGRDDLLSRDWNGRLRMTFFMTGENLARDSVESFWAGGADASAAGLELVGTLDLDRDGDAEIAWIDDEGLQIWDASKGPESLPEF